jgi:hypothetical protein
MIQRSSRITATGSTQTTTTAARVKITIPKKIRISKFIFKSISKNAGTSSFPSYAELIPNSGLDTFRIPHAAAAGMTSCSANEFPVLVGYKKRFDRIKWPSKPPYKYPSIKPALSNIFPAAVKASFRKSRTGISQVIIGKNQNINGPSILIARVSVGFVTLNFLHLIKFKTAER